MTTLLETKRPRLRPPLKAKPGTRPPVATSLRLLTFNIGAAGAPRAGAILDWLESRADDVIVLTETSNGPGTQLLADGLQANGFCVHHTRNPSERGVLVASKMPIPRNFSERVAVTLPCRASAVVLDTGPRKIALVGVYIPSRDRSDVKVMRKAAFITSLLNSLRELPAAQRAQLVIRAITTRSHGATSRRLPDSFRGSTGGLTP